MCGRNLLIVDAAQLHSVTVGMTLTPSRVNIAVAPCYRITDLLVSNYMPLTELKTKSGLLIRCTIEGQGQSLLLFRTR